MAVEFIQETYNGFPTIYDNALGWIDVEIKFSTRFALSSSISNTVTYGFNSTDNWLTFQQSDFGDAGFLQGDSIDITYYDYSLPSNPFVNPVVITATIFVSSMTTQSSYTPFFI